MMQLTLAIRRILPLALGAMLALPSASADSAKPSPATDQVLKRLQAKYAAAKSFKADFRQQVKSLRFAQQEHHGRVVFQKKGKMRWDYEKPVKKRIVADGKTLWIYDPETNQVLINESYKSAQLPASVSFLWGEGKIKDNFKVQKAEKNAEGLLVITLEPKQKSEQLRELVLQIKEKDLTIAGTQIKDFQGNTNTLKFDNQVFGGEQKASLFIFKIPKKAAIVHLDRINFRF